MRLCQLTLTAAASALLASSSFASPAGGDSAAFLGGQPLAFVENTGQWDSPAQFVARGGPMVVRLEPGALGIDLCRDEDARVLALRLAFVGADPAAGMEGEARLPGVFNYLVGNDPDLWRTGVARYESVRYRELYPGIDLRLREHDGRVEYDLVLAPGADPAAVVVRCEGVDGLTLEPDGALRMDTGLGPVRQSPPRTWELLADGERRELASRFVLLDERSFGFALPERDAARPVVIDPGLEWLTYYGGAGLNGPATCTWSDATGRVAIAGRTTSGDLPGAGTAPGGETDGYVAVLDPSASGAAQLVWATYLGGSGIDVAFDVGFDAQGDLIVVGGTDSTA